MENSPIKYDELKHIKNIESGEEKKEHSCKYIKRVGESCTLNNNCKYPNCE